MTGKQTRVPYEIVRAENPMERWAGILDGLYAVSSHGRIYSFHENLLMKTYVKDGRYVIVLLRHRGRTRNYYVHRLVAQAFVANPDGKPEVNHIDAIRTHNHFSNLEWVTPRENMAHAKKNGLLPRCGKATDEMIRQIRAAKGTCREIGARFGMSPQNVNRIQLRQLWGHIE